MRRLSLLLFLLILSASGVLAADMAVVTARLPEKDSVLLSAALDAGDTGRIVFHVGGVKYARYIERSPILGRYLVWEGAGSPQSFLSYEDAEAVFTRRAVPVRYARRVGANYVRAVCDFPFTILYLMPGMRRTLVVEPLVWSYQQIDAPLQSALE